MTRSPLFGDLPGASRPARPEVVRRRRGCCGRKLVFIGDSAHATSPQLWQGANLALLDVRALAQAFAVNGDLHDAIEAYARKRRFHVMLYQGLSRVFTPFYQSDSVMLPLGRDQLVAGLSPVPVIQRLLAGIVSGTFGLTDNSLIETVSQPQVKSC